MMYVAVKALMLGARASLHLASSNADKQNPAERLSADQVCQRVAPRKKHPSLNGSVTFILRECVYLGVCLDKEIIDSRMILKRFSD